MNTTVKQFTFDTLQDCFNFMQQPLANYELFTRELSKRIKVKEHDNEQFSFDVELDERIKQSLVVHGITGDIFSEESGFFEIPGNKHYRVVYDPFCNSSLASRTFREGALGISIFTYDYRFITSAILDFQTGLMAIIEDNVTRFYQVQSGNELSLEPRLVTALDEAWIVLAIENARERAYLPQAKEIMDSAKRVVISSGHIYWLKLAAGFIDAYADPFGGEELYEMFACIVAQKAGCIVTDRNGRNFDPSENLKQFEEDRHFIYYPIAARTPELHQTLLASLKTF